MFPPAPEPNQQHCGNQNGTRGENTAADVREDHAGRAHGCHTALSRARPDSDPELEKQHKSEDCQGQALGKTRTTEGARQLRASRYDEYGGGDISDPSRDFQPFGM